MTVQLPGGYHAEVIVLAPSSGFTRSRIADATATSLAGTAAWYGQVSTWPANGRPDPTSGKQDAAVPSVAWSTKNGWWIIVQSDDGRTGAALGALAESLNIAPKAAPTRVPLAPGDLPVGAELTGVEMYFGTSGGKVVLQSASVAVLAGTTTIDVSMTTPSLTIEPTDAQGLGLPHNRKIRRLDGYVLTVGGSDGLSPAASAKVLSSVDIATDPTTENDGWALVTSIQ